MQKIQLYIEGQRVDMFKDESVSITDTIQNVKDIGKIFTAFSKTFSLPASKTNNKIFKHYYNFDIVGGFDARIKKDSNIELNNLPFKDGKIKLEGVDLKDNKPHTYRITFFGSTVTLKDLLGDDKLQALDLSTYDKEYSISGISTGLSLDPTVNDVVVPLISHTSRLFYDSTTGHAHEDLLSGNMYYENGTAHTHGVKWDDLKYAIRIDKIIQAIGVKYGLTFSDDFFNSSNEHYYNLFLWLHRKKGDVENLSGVSQTIASGWSTTSLGDTLTQMISPSTMRVTGEPFRYLDYSLVFTTTTSFNYKVSLQKDGVEVYNTGVVSGGNVTINQIDFNLEQGDYTAYVESDENITFSNVEWDILYNLGGAGGIVQNTYSVTSYGHSNAFQFYISQQIPEMKTIDFLTGIFKTFNLTAYVDKINGNIVVKTLDDFYNAGVSYDITKHVDSSKGSVNIALPFREINFEHEDTKTFLAAKHNQLFGKVWGKESYVGGEKLDGGVYNIKTPFSQLKYERLVNKNDGLNTTIQVGYFVDDNQESYFGKPLIFYPIKQSVTATSISFVTTETTHVEKTSYNIPSNSVSLLSGTSKKNINFYAELNEYTATSDFTDTLFEMYYKNYITSVFNTRNRITKVSAYLPLNILLNYSLADRFVINGNSYKINSLTTNFKSGKSEIELLNDL
tara:strand:- start:87 stop:2117 length:2031 start_codon:yes stop_codon:yes gene_type:complete